jgi:Tfp pilus assembly protein PilZ
VDLKFDQRANKRLKCEAFIWHDNLLPEIFYNAKMYNLSKGGVYFESDQIIYPGEDIYIGLKDPASPVNDNKAHIRAEIKWRKDLQNASFRFGYGAKLIHPIDTLVKSIDAPKLGRQSTQGNVFKHKQDPRKHPRKLYRKAMFFASKSKNYKGLITNISRGGAHIITRNKFYLGQMIQLIIPGDRQRKDVKLKGWVVRLSPEGLGVRFDRRKGRDRRSVLDRRDSRKLETKTHNRK